MLDNQRATSDERRATNPKFYRGKGCDKCMQTGYRGRIGIFELMPIDERVRNLITAKAPASQIKEAARGAGMVLMMNDGLEKVKSGLTTVEEVLRVTQEE